MDYNGHTDFTWTYSAKDPEHMISFEPDNVNTEGFADNQLWAFVGNIVDGFRIYNKAAGFDKWVYAEGSKVMMGNRGKQDLWKPSYAPKRSYAKYCVFSTEGTEFICYPSGGSNSRLTFGASDDSATCWFVAASEPMLEQVAEYNFSYEDPDDTFFPKVKPVGSFEYNGTEFPESDEVIAAATADPYDYTAAENLRKLIDKFETNVNYVLLDANKWYRITSANGTNEKGKPTGWGNNYLFTGADNDMKVYSQEMLATRKHNYHTLFNFIPVNEPDAENSYYIQSQGCYLATPSSNKELKQTDNIDQAGRYQLYKIDAPAQYALGVDFTDEDERKFIHQANAGTSAPIAITGWEAGPGGSHFYIIPANDLEVLLPATLGDLNVGFGYFPCPVKALDEDTKLYYISHEVNDNNHVAAYTEVQTVPAHTPFMVVKEDAEKAVLQIVDANAEATAEVEVDETTEPSAEAVNHLTGSLRSTTASAGDYVLGQDSKGNVAFVKATEETAVAGNSVYLPAANVAEEAGDILPLAAHVEQPNTPGDDAITEISATKNSKVYDLQGRRLATPTRGINIINGQKVIVK